MHSSTFFPSLPVTPHFLLSRISRWGESSAAPSFFFFFRDPFLVRRSATGPSACVQLLSAGRRSHPRGLESSAAIAPPEFSSGPFLPNHCLQGGFIYFACEQMCVAFFTIFKGPSRTPPRSPSMYERRVGTLVRVYKGGIPPFPRLLRPMSDPLRVSR